MSKLAFLFAGQGSQTPGMGKSLLEASQAAKEVFARAETLRPGLAALCFEGEKAVLSQTENASPALFTVSLAAAYALKERGVVPCGAAGFSLGEIPALAFTKMLPEKDAFALVLKRSEWMAQCAAENAGGMAAVLGMADDDVIALAESCGVFAVNFNAPGQVVVAGLQNPLQRFIAAAKGKARIVPLAVSGPFHTKYMQKAAEGLALYLQGLSLAPGEIPLYANASALPYGASKESPKALLARQVTSPVLWRQTIEQMQADGFSAFVEVGPGATLRGLLKKIAPKALCFSVSDGESLQKTAESLKENGYA